MMLIDPRERELQSLAAMAKANGLILVTRRDPKTGQQQTAFAARPMGEWKPHRVTPAKAADVAADVDADISFAIRLGGLPLYLNQSGNLVRFADAHIFATEEKARLAADIHAARSECYFEVATVRGGQVVPTPEHP